MGGICRKLYKDLQKTQAKSSSLQIMSSTGEEIHNKKTIGEKENDKSKKYESEGEQSVRKV